MSNIHSCTEFSTITKEMKEVFCQRGGICKKRCRHKRMGLQESATVRKTWKNLLVLDSLADGKCETRGWDGLFPRIC